MTEPQDLKPFFEVLRRTLEHVKQMIEPPPLLKAHPWQSFQDAVRSVLDATKEQHDETND